MEPEPDGDRPLVPRGPAHPGLDQVDRHVADVGRVLRAHKNVKANANQLLKQKKNATVSSQALGQCMILKCDNRWRWLSIFLWPLRLEFLSELPPGHIMDQDLIPLFKSKHDKLKDKVSLS